MHAVGMSERFPSDPAAPRVAAGYGLEPSTLLGSGGEATVYALDRERVLRVHRPGASLEGLGRRQRLLEELGSRAPDLPFGIPRVLEISCKEERWVSIEPRWPGQALSAVLKAAEGAAREALVRSYLDSGRRLSQVRLVRTFYGDLLQADAIRTASFREYLELRARRSLDVAGEPLARVDAGQLARALPEPARSAFVYLDVHPDNVLVERGRVSAVVDFGAVAIVGEERLGAVVPATYLLERDQPVAQAWLREQGLSDMYEPTRRWIAAFWSFARDDVALFEWCQKVLLG